MGFTMLSKRIVSWRAIYQRVYDGERGPYRTDALSMNQLES